MGVAHLSQVEEEKLEAAELKNLKVIASKQTTQMYYTKEVSHQD